APAGHRRAGRAPGVSPAGVRRAGRGPGVSGLRTRSPAWSRETGDARARFPRADDDEGRRRRVSAAAQEYGGSGRGDTAEAGRDLARSPRSEEHTSELQSRENLVCRLLLEKK